MKLAIAFALAMSAFAQSAPPADDMPSRFVFTGLSYNSLESAKPEAGYAGFGQKITDKAGTVFLLSGWTITSKNNTAETGILKPITKVGSLSIAVVGSAGVVTEGSAVTEAGKPSLNTNVGLGWSGGTLMTVPIVSVTGALHIPGKYEKLHFFFGGQVLHQNIGTGGIEVGGQRIRIGFGIARDWSAN